VVTPSSELIGPSFAGLSLCWIPERLGSFHPNQLGSRVVSLPNLTLYDPVSDYLCVMRSFIMLPSFFLQNQKHSTQHSPHTLSSELITISPIILRDVYDITPPETPTSLRTVPTILFLTGSSPSLTPSTTLTRIVHTLLHHSSGSRSFPDVLLAPAFLPLTCGWRIFPGLGSDHLPVDISITLANLTLLPLPSTSKKHAGINSRNSSPNTRLDAAKASISYGYLALYPPKNNSINKSKLGKGYQTLKFMVIWPF